MKAAYVAELNTDDPLSGLRVGQRPEPEVREGWTTIRVRAASINHHDMWALRGVGLSADRLPMILGSDAAGLDENGQPVLVYPVIDDGKSRSVLSERYQGALAEQVSVPVGNTVPIPAGMTFEQAACLPTAWLTAYKMLFCRISVGAGDLVLVQGASGGLSTALIVLAHAAGARVWVTGRNAEKREFAASLGAEAIFESGARLPERVHYVMDSVGAATWDHSLKCLRPGGTMVVPGGTSGYRTTVDITPVFARQLSILGSSMGTLADLTALVEFCVEHGIRPPHSVTPLDEAIAAFAAMHSGAVLGKLVLQN